MLDAFKRYDIRGSYPDEINESLMGIIGESFPFSEKVVIGGDLRVSTPFLKNALLYSLNAEKVCDIGITSTDILAFCAKDRNAKGIMITASHNPWDHNGVKFINESSIPFTNQQLNELKNKALNIKSITKKEKFYKPNYQDAYDSYFLKVKEILGSSFDLTIYAVNSGALPPLKYALKNHNFSFSLVGESYVLDESLSSNPTKKFVESLNIKKGVVLDGDADRGVIKDGGKVINAHYLIYGFAKALNIKNIVVSIDFSETLKKMLENEGVRVYVTPVGDVFVSNMCALKKCDFFAEPNYHFGFPEFSYYSSGVLAGLYYEGFNVANHLPPLHLYFLEKSYYVKNLEQWNKLKDHIKQSYEVLSDIDGIKFIHNGVVILLRFSGTNRNKIRLYLESADKAKLKNIQKEIVNLLKKYEVIS